MDPGHYYGYYHTEQIAEGFSDCDYGGFSYESTEQDAFYAVSDGFFDTEIYDSLQPQYSETDALLATTMSMDPQYATGNLSDMHIDPQFSREHAAEGWNCLSTAQENSNRICSFPASDYDNYSIAGSSGVPTAFEGLHPAAFTFSFIIQKADDMELGINVCHMSGSRVLRVEGIMAGGATEAWNQQCMARECTEKVILPGDHIISVNGIARDSEKMLEECRDGQFLRLTITRYNDVPRYNDASARTPCSYSVNGLGAVNGYGGSPAEEPLRPPGRWIYPDAIHIAHEAPTDSSANQVVPQLDRTQWAELLSDSSVCRGFAGSDAKWDDSSCFSHRTSAKTERTANGRCDGELCTFCRQCVKSDRLGERHMCRVFVKFLCPGCGKRWRSSRGRYDPQAKHVYGQRCDGKECNDQNGIIEEYWPLYLPRERDGEESQQMKRKGKRRKLLLDMGDECKAFYDLQGAWRDVCGPVACVDGDRLIVMPEKKNVQLILYAPSDSSTANVRCLVEFDLYGVHWSGEYLTDGRINWTDADNTCVWWPTADGDKARAWSHLVNPSKTLENS